MFLAWPPAALHGTPPGVWHYEARGCVLFIVSVQCPPKYLTLSLVGMNVITGYNLQLLCNTVVNKMGLISLPEFIF